MIPEVLRYRLSDANRSSFETAYRDALVHLRASPHFLGMEILRSQKEPQNVLVVLRWDSETGHLEGFRKSEHFPPFLALVRPFLNDLVEMEHYATIVQVSIP